MQTMPLLAIALAPVLAAGLTVGLGLVLVDGRVDARTGGSSCETEVGVGPRAKPNVLIFLTDDQSALDAGCLGSTDLRTPAIDALAATGVRFTRAYAHTACCPSRALLLTGRHPQRSGVDSWTQGDMSAARGVNMFRAEVTLAEQLKQHGYRTGLVGKWHLGAARSHGPTEQGFDSFFGFRGGFIDNRNHHCLHGRGFHDLYRGTERQLERGAYFPDLVVREANRFLSRESEKPFFLLVAFNLPHYPEQPAPAFEQQFTDLPEPRRSYVRMIATVDDQIGKIVATLERTGARDDTIIVFASDNGHSTEDYRIRPDHHRSGLAKGHDYGAHGGGGNTGKWRGHQGTFFEGGIRVPAILNYPRRVPGGVARDQVISLADFYPTILDLCGLPKPAHQLDGKSLTAVIGSAHAPSPHRVMHWQWMDMWAVLRGDWKLIRRGKKVTLANLADQQPERRNHASAQPDLVAELTDLHREWAVSVMPKPRHAPMRGMLRLARVDPRQAEPWPELNGTGYTAWRSDRAVILAFDGAIPPKVVIPRLANPIQKVQMVGQRRAKVPLEPMPDRWVLRTSDRPKGAKPIVVVHTVDWPRLHADLGSIALGSDRHGVGVIVLPAHRATTVGQRLRYEPQPHKNTLGYWTSAADHAEWRIRIDRPGTFSIEVLQGCGRGQGGSTMAVVAGGQSIEFLVEDTGHFQNFVRRRVGRIELTAGTHVLEVRVVRMAKNAAMDLREVKLGRIPPK